LLFGFYIIILARVCVGYATDQDESLDEGANHYSDFHTIDWLKDIAKDRLRHRSIIKSL